jgi:hypothetical protein
MNPSRAQKGVTLLETLLALAVASMITLMGFRLYNYGTFDTDTRYVQQNVDNLFSAAVMFYRANCASTLDTTTTPYVVNMATQLITPQYLASNWNVQPYNPLVDFSDTTGGYIVQYNLLPTSATPMNAVCSSGDCSQTSSPKIYPQALASGLRPLQWEIQVSVKAGTNVNSSQMSYILNATGASCLTNSGSGGSVNNCRSPGSAPYEWIAYTRLPALASPNSLSPYWVMMPMVKQFNLQYTHDQMYELSSGTYIDNGNGNAQGYYTCGN